MAFTPFTLEEAEEIREDFEDLADTEFKIGNSPLMLVDAVLISPFADADKNDFAERYYATKNSDNLHSLYPDSIYDVMLITSEADNNTNFSFIGIREFAELRGIKYEFPVRE
jgi:hypothetical protein